MYKINRILKESKYIRALLITAAAAMILAAAAFFIYFYGNSETVTVQTSAETRETEMTGSDDISRSTDSVFVDISGCIKNPGVYEMPYGSRIFEVVDKAGGFTKRADTALINQAETVTDGMKINVPDKKREAEHTVSGQTSSDTVTSAESLININTADSETLQQITGIGPVTAEKIISYRETNGAFRSVEEITNVSGIGEKTLQKIRSRITV